MRPFSLIAMVGLLVGGLASSARADYLMATNFSSLGRSVMLFNKSDGSLVNKNWIVSDATNVLNSPTEALAIGTDVWISDQVQNKVFRYDLTTGTYKTAVTGSATVNLSNIRGIECVGNTVYVANAGASPSFGNAVVMFDATSGNYLGNFPINGDLPPWDVKYYNGQLYVSEYTSSFTTGVSKIDRYDLSGNYLSNFYTMSNTNKTTLIGPQQINIDSDGSNLLVGGFINNTGTTQSGVYQLDSAGAPLAQYAAGLGPRAGYRLDNGKIMFTKGDGVWAWDTSNGTYSALLAGTNVNAKYINSIAFMPEPGSLAALALGTLLLGARRR